VTFPKVGYLMRSLATSSTIKNTVELEQADNLFPGYSASGQDVWLPYYDYDGPAIVLSAVGAQCGKTFLAKGKWGTVANTTAFAIDTKKASPKFLHYMTNQKDFWEKDGSAQPYVKVSETLRKRFFIPDLATQRQIADFLDRETARIDLLIEKKQRLVALLGEKAKTKKLHLVTGQQKDDQKATKLLWASSIPDHWKECAVWMLFELGRGRVMSHEYIAENEGQYPIYSSQTADDGVMGHIKTYDFDGDYLTWTTDGAKAGTVFRRRGKFNCTNVCGTLRPLTRSIDLNYAQVALDTATDFFVRHDINPKLMNGVMSKIRIPYPPLYEQRAIGAEITKIEESYQPILDKNQRSIDRLKEYRSALITAAVTGQIDVTTYAQSGTPDRCLDAIREEMGA